MSFLNQLTTIIKYIALIGILAHILGEALPRKWFHWDRFPYRTFSWEREGRVYEAMGIRRWKDRLPDMSRLMPDMVKKKLSAADPMSLVQETCVAEFIHVVLSVLGLACLWLWPGFGGTAVTLVYILLGNVPFIIIQRYNRPRLVRLYERMCAKRSKEA